MTQTMLLEPRVVRTPAPGTLQRIVLLTIALMTLPPMFYFCGESGSTDKPVPQTHDAGMTAVDAGDPADAGEPDSGLLGIRRVFFVSPLDGDEVESPVTVVLGSEDFPIEPANHGDALDRGHFHVMVDLDCLSFGTQMVPDANHFDLIHAEHEIKIDLSPGEHRLCVQAATGDHYSLEYTAVIKVEVVK